MTSAFSILKDFNHSQFVLFFFFFAIDQPVYSAVNQPVSSVLCWHVLEGLVNNNYILCVLVFKIELLSLVLLQLRALTLYIQEHEIGNQV